MVVGRKMLLHVLWVSYAAPQSMVPLRGQEAETVCNIAACIMFYLYRYIM